MSLKPSDIDPAGSPWRTPQEVMLRLKVRKNKNALQSRMQAPITSPTKSTSPEKRFSPQSVKRRNPFRRSPEALKQVRLETEAVDNQSSCDRRLFALIDNSVQTMNSFQGRNDSSAPVELASRKSLLSQENAVSANNKETVTKKPLKSLLDWSLKSRVRIVSSEPILPPSSRLKPSQEASGLTAFSRCVFDHLTASGDQSSDLDSSVGAQLQQLCGFWEYPSFPCYSAMEKGGSKATPFASAVGASAELQNLLLSEWRASLTSLYSMLKARHCPFFYITSNGLNVIFKAAGIGGHPDITALVAPTTSGFRRALDQADIEFQLPLYQPSTNKPSEAAPLAEKVVEDNWEGEDANEDLDDSFVEELMSDVVAGGRRGHPDKNLDHRAESAVFLRGTADVQGLYNYLLNSKNLTRGTGVPPSLVSPVAFLKSSLSTLSLRRSVIEVPSKGGKATQAHCLELSGPVLPSTVLSLCHLAQKHLTSFRLSLSTLKGAEGLNARTESEEEEETALSFARSNMAGCGLPKETREELVLLRPPPSSHEQEPLVLSEVLFQEGVYRRLILLCGLRMPVLMNKAVSDEDADEMIVSPGEDTFNQGRSYENPNFQLSHLDELNSNTVTPSSLEGTMRITPSTPSSVGHSPSVHVAPEASIQEEEDSPQEEEALLEKRPGVRGRHKYAQLDVRSMGVDLSSGPQVEAEDRKVEAPKVVLRPRKEQHIPIGWEKYEDENGPYYWHIKSGTIQRDLPTTDSTFQANFRSSLNLEEIMRHTSSPGLSTAFGDSGMAGGGFPRSITTETLSLISSQREKRQSFQLNSSPVPTRSLRYRVRSLGCVEVPEEELSADRSSRAVNRCIVDLSERDSLRRARGEEDGAETQEEEDCGRWGNGEPVTLELDDAFLRLVDPATAATLHSQAIHTIRVWGVGRDNGRDFAYVARDRVTRRHLCHVFVCDTPAREIANALRDICKKIMLERSQGQPTKNNPGAGSSALGSASLPPVRPSHLPTEGRRQDLAGPPLSSVLPPSFPTPMEEPRKVLRARFVGAVSVDKPSGMDVVNSAIENAIAAKPEAAWEEVRLAIAPSKIVITRVKDEFTLSECRVRFLSFLGIGKNDPRQCAFIIHTAKSAFQAYVFSAEPTAGQVCRTIEAACKLRYQKCIDAHGLPPPKAASVEGGESDAPPSAPSLQIVVVFFRLF
ncbi:unnamed protein product [Cyprideis torosa]|uniref:Uncharacterized protein n=1 Tax=Cyprideis torosa TaxID=163714 RepID=A0A7R8W883_9CRUS|nr:unnamed protein product [Cyprideis torosa]CAG0883176.1 unnamed protein product [Cyprideis torosa]